jgi:hypothetical protein
MLGTHLGEKGGTFRGERRMRGQTNYDSLGFVAIIGVYFMAIKSSQSPPRIPMIESMTFSKRLSRPWLPLDTPPRSLRNGTLRTASARSLRN